MNKIKAPKDTTPYQKHYSEAKFWKNAKSLGKKVLKPALLLYYVMMSPDVPLTTKATIAGALGYLILPLDLVPDFIPIAGFTDDAAALWAIVSMCQNHITPDIEAQADTKLQELLG